MPTDAAKTAAPIGSTAIARSNMAAKFAQDKLSNQHKLALSRNPHGSIPALFEDCVTAAADRLIAARGGPAWEVRAAVQAAFLTSSRRGKAPIEPSITLMC